MEDDAMLTIAEAADALGVAGPYLARLLDAGRLPYRMSGDQQLPAGRGRRVHCGA
jgi:excisionase family DNA binding protein